MQIPFLSLYCCFKTKTVKVLSSRVLISFTRSHLWWSCRWWLPNLFTYMLIFGRNIGYLWWSCWRWPTSTKPPLTWWSEVVFGETQMGNSNSNSAVQDSGSGWSTVVIIHDYFYIDCLKMIQIRSVNSDQSGPIKFTRSKPPFANSSFYKGLLVSSTVTWSRNLHNLERVNISMIKTTLYPTRVRTTRKRF